MTIEDARPSSRRARREQAATAQQGESSSATSPDALPHDGGPDDTGPVDGHDGATGPVIVRNRAGRRALAWLDDGAVPARRAPADLTDSTHPYAEVSADLLARRPRRSPLRPGVILPVLSALCVAGIYAAATLFWPLYAVPPAVEKVAIADLASPATALAWPATGSAAVGVTGFDGAPASAADAKPMASITKLVTALMILDQMPLTPGESGPSFTFTSRDRQSYYDYLAKDESALNVPVGGSLTQYQMLQGMLIGSANNYADRLASNLWPSDAVFARAANEWLASHGVPGITIVEPTGFDTDNVATNDALLILATKALANPVIAEIVRTPSVELPGAGLVTNTNDLLADPGVLGIKTGALDRFNLLSAKDIVVGDVTIRLTASVLSQPDPETRSAATRALFAQLEAELQPTTTVAAGTTAGVVETKWGARADVVTADAAPVILWNGGAATLETEYSLGDSRAQGDQVGTLTATGPFGSTSVALRLDGDIEPPDAWWRLTHPLDLFGLAG